MALTKADWGFLAHKSTIMGISQRKCAAAGGVNKPNKTMRSSQNLRDGYEKHRQLTEKMWQIRRKRKKGSLMRRENTFSSVNLAFPTWPSRQMLRRGDTHLTPQHFAREDKPLFRSLFRLLNITQAANSLQEITHNICHILFTPPKTILAVRSQNTH